MPNDTTNRAQRRSSAQVREAILLVAAQQFAERPYTDVTTAEIAKAAGVSPSVLYRHFATKADLFREAAIGPLTASLERFAARWRAQRHGDEPWQSREIAEAFMADLYTSVTEHRDALIALVGARDELDAETATAVASAINDVLDQILLVGIAEKNAGRLWFPREGLDLAIRMLVAMVFGAAVFDRWLMPESARSAGPEAAVSVLTDLATWGLSRSLPTEPPRLGD